MVSTEAFPVIATHPTDSHRSYWDSPRKKPPTMEPTPSPKQGAGKSGILKQISLYNGGNVFMVCNMLCKYDKRDRNIGNGNGGNIASGKLAERAISGKECELRHLQKCGKCDASVFQKRAEYTKIHDLECIDIRRNPDYRKDSSDCVTPREYP